MVAHPDRLAHPGAIAVLQSIAGYAVRGVLDQEWHWALIQFPRWMS